MKLIKQLHRWRAAFLAGGTEPAFIPLTAEEISVVASDCPSVGHRENFMARPPEIFGLSVFDSPFAEEMRARQISLPVTQLSEWADIPFQTHTSRGDIYYDDVMRRRLVANICSDTSMLSLTFDWDSLAKFKRKFRLTRWWSVKTRTVKIEGRILYPFLKVSLPHNKHRVRFTQVS